MTTLRQVDDLGPAVRAGVDTIIDARSPSEFAHDHAPGAVNLPVLSDAERAEVGRTYVQDDSFLARRRGAALVARNIAAHLEGALAGHGGGWRPLVYCWRGGQRSQAMAAVLSQVGWRTAVLRGGYQTYRRAVVRALYDAPPLPGVVLLEGGTGAGKTAMLQALAARGAQVLDLEGMAEHRGSLLGALPGRPQPSQKMFESRLAAAMAALDPTRPVVVEAESSRVGEVTLPPALWSAMTDAPAVELRASPAVRARRLAGEYGADLDRAAVDEALGRLPRHLAKADVRRWRDLLAGGELDALARELIDAHYDPAYARTAHRHGRRSLGVVEVSDASPDALARAADAVAALLPAIHGGEAGHRERVQGAIAGGAR